MLSNFQTGNRMILDDEQEFEGETVEKAVLCAMKAFGVPKDRLDIRIVCEECRGLFGMAGASKAKIKANIKRHK